MLKYWAKNRLLIDVILSLVISLTFVFGFTYPNQNAVKTIEETNSVYLESQIDYQLPSPSRDQLKIISELDFIDKTFGYYLTKTNVQSNKTSKVNLIMSDCLNELEFTMFNSGTLLSSKEKTDSFAYIDETASKALNVGIGDTITTTIAGNNVSYVVCSLYKESKLFKEGAVIVDFSGATKTAYESAVSSNGYSAAFIKTNNQTSCSDYLRNYIPEGRLKDRSEFETDEAYETYNNSILNGNFSNEITNFSNNRAVAESELKNATSKRNLICYIGVGSILIFYAAISFILRIRKSEDKYFLKIVKDKNSIKTYRLLSCALSAILFFGLAFILSIVLGFMNFILVPLLLSTAGIIIINILNLLLDRKYKRA